MAYKVEKKRARRLRRTQTVAHRRRMEFLAKGFGDDSRPLHPIYTCDHYYAKRPTLACDCRKRRKGAPRVAAGMCHIGDRDRIYQWRNEARELVIAVRTGRYESP